MTERGVILVNTGEGKGKTTAALGTALRAAGNGLKVLVLQFIKGSYKYGELEGIKKLGDNIEIRPMGKGFVFHRQKPTEETLKEHEALAKEAWEMVKREVTSDAWDLVVLDEINYAISYGMLETGQVLELLNNKPKRLHMILTGRNAPQEVIDVADTVTEMRMVKHAYKQGIKAARGIEF